MSITKVINSGDLGAHFRRGTKAGRSGGGLGEWAFIILAALLAAVVIRYFVLQTFWIPSESMTPTLQINDRVIVNKLAYDFGDIERGDLVVFERPPNDPNIAIKDLIKRVIALDGDLVEAREGTVYVNGVQSQEPYIRAGALTENLPPTTIPEGEVFVMGDNRTNSADSRVFGPIDQSLIIGEASLRIWPLSRFGSP